MLGLGPETVADREGVLCAQLPIDARRGIVANAPVQNQAGVPAENLVAIYEAVRDVR